MLIGFGDFSDTGIHLGFSGDQVFLLDQIGQDQTHADARQCALLEPFRLQRDITLHAALLHVFTGALHQTVDFLLDQRLRHGDRVQAVQLFHHSFTQTLVNTLLHFTLQVLLDFSLQVISLAAFNAHGLDEFFSQFRNDRRLDLLDVQIELHSLTCQFCVAVIGREGQVKGLAGTGHATFDGGLELGQQRTLAQHHRVILGFTTGKGHTILLTQEVDHDTVFLLGGTVGVFVSHALFTQNFQGFLNVSSRDFMHRALDFGSRHIGQGELGVQLKGRRKGQRFAEGITLRLDARVTGHLEVLLGNRFTKGAANDLVERFITRLQAILLLDHLGRDLARAETGDLQGLTHARQASIGRRIQFFGINGQINRTRQRRDFNLGFLHGFGGAHEFVPNQ